jgi:hypothetical protein
MKSETALTRWLGVAFVAQFTTSMAAAVLTVKLLGAGASGALVAAAGNLTTVRAGALTEVLTGAGIAALATLMFARFGDANRPVALVAQGFWYAEAILVTVSGVALYALAGVGGQMALTPAASASLAGAGALAFSLYQSAFTVHMLFFCLGAVLWYPLMCRSQVVPKWLARWGFFASLPLLVSTLLTLWDRSLNVGVWAGLPYAPFELVVGTWLIVTAGRSVAGLRAARRGTRAPQNLKGALS